MVSALSYTQQKEKCVYYGACVVIYTKKRSMCTLVHVLSYTQQKEKCVYYGACVVIYTTKR